MYCTTTINLVLGLIFTICHDKWISNPVDRNIRFKT